jgi:integrase
MTRPTKPRSKLTDKIISSAVDFLEGETRVFHDAVVPGLRIRIGRNKRTWIYLAEYQIKGKRGTAFKRLGFWPRMEVADARKAALQEAAKVASGRPQPGRRQAITLDQAAEDYLASLKARGKKSGRFIGSMIRVHLLPELGRFTLAELSDAPALVRDHHAKISGSAPVSANRAMSILSAIYRHASKLDRSLRRDASPISAVIMNNEEPAQTAMAFSDFPRWRAAVDRLPPIRQAYHRLLLLTGMRGAEAQALKWSDVNLRVRTITLRGTKTGKDVSIPMTSAIASALKLARPMRDGVIFPGARKWADDLPVKGHALRHSFISVAHDIGVNEIHVRLLVGHSLTGVHASYLTQMVMEGGPGLKASQRRLGLLFAHCPQAPVAEHVFQRLDLRPDL